MKANKSALIPPTVHIIQWVQKLTADGTWLKVVAESVKLKTDTQTGGYNDNL